MKQAVPASTHAIIAGLLTLCDRGPMTGIDVELMLINAAATLGVLLQCEVRAQLMTGMWVLHICISEL